MPYVSANYVPEDPTMPLKAVGSKPVAAIDDQGIVWFLTEDSQVGDWLAYLAGGGTIAPADPTDQNITSAPPDLFGGPTIEQVLSGG